MNTLRSSERHLTLIAFKSKVKAKVGQQCTRVGQQYTRYNRNVSTAKYPRLGQFHAKIRLPQIRELSTDQPPIDISILNPTKMGPRDLKDQAIRPLVRPLTNPRFPKDKIGMPSVTKILSATMPASSQYILDRWKEAMIKKLGAAGFNKYQAETFERGRLLHALLEKYLLHDVKPTAGEAELTKEIVQNLWKSIEKVVRDKITNVRLVEHTVTHPIMKYRGIVDCVACYEDELVVIDFKTAEKHKKTIESLYDNPLQVTAYCGAINCDTQIPESVIDRNITSGLVIVAYVDGSEASIYRFGQDQVNAYWKQWSARFEQYSRLDEMREPKFNQS